MTSKLRKKRFCIFEQNSPLMKVIFVFLFALALSPCRADLGTSYCVKATVTTKANKVYTGYFFHGGYDFSVSRNEEGTAFVYHALNKDGSVKAHEDAARNRVVISAAETEFFKDFLASLYDTITIYQDVVMIPFPDEGTVPAFRGRSNRLAKAEIARVKVHYLAETSVLFGVLTPVTIADTFITAPVAKREFLGQFDCVYHAFYFSKPSPAATALVKKYATFISNRKSSATKEEFLTQEKLAVRKMLELKKYGVLIIYSCSC
jgi:hypothetical protein